MKSLFTEMLCKAPNRQAKANRLVGEKGGRSRTKESNNVQHSFRNTKGALLLLERGFFHDFFAVKVFRP